MKELTPEQENYIGDLQHHEKKIRKDFEKEYKEYLKILDEREERGLKPISFDDYLWSKSEKKHKSIPVNPERLDLILKVIGRKKLDVDETYSDISGKIKR